jgi:hypothetical protein
MVVDLEKMRAEMRSETRKFVLQLIAALGTAFAGGAAVPGLILHRTGKL